MLYKFSDNIPCEFGRKVETFPVISKYATWPKATGTTWADGPVEAASVSDMTGFTDRVDAEAKPWRSVINDLAGTLEPLPKLQALQKEGAQARAKPKRSDAVIDSEAATFSKEMWDALLPPHSRFGFYVHEDVMDRLHRHLGTVVGFTKDEVIVSRFGFYQCFPHGDLVAEIPF